MRKVLTLLLAFVPATALAGGSTPPGVVQSGSITSGHCAQFSATNVVIDAGATCGTGTSGVSQATGTGSQILINGTTGAHTGALTFTLPAQINLGTAGSAQGAVGLAGSSAGTGTLQPPATATGLTWTLPSITGTIMSGANNLSDLSSASTSRTNLAAAGLGDNNTYTGTNTFNSTVTGTGITALFASPLAIGTTTPAAATFTNITATGTVALPTNTTVNGLTFANVAFSGSASDLLTGSLLGARLGAFSGDLSTAGGTYVLTLNNVNSSPGTYTCVTETVNAKGLVTNASSGTCSGGSGPGGPGESIALDSSHSLALDTSHALRMQ